MLLHSHKHADFKGVDNMFAGNCTGNAQEGPGPTRYSGWQRRSCDRLSAFTLMALPSPTSADTICSAWLALQLICLAPLTSDTLNTSVMVLPESVAGSGTHANWMIPRFLEHLQAIIKQAIMTICRLSRCYGVIGPVIAYEQNYSTTFCPEARSETGA
jgi:hypothetical protein